MGKHPAKGTIFAYESATGPSVWSTVPSVGDFEMPLVPQKDIIDATDHDSGGYEESESGIGLAETIEIPIVGWDGTNTHHAAMVTRAAADTPTNFKVTMKDTKIATFAGKVLGVRTGNPVRGLLSATITVRTSGAIAYS